jgi:hypothetical protein
MSSENEKNDHFEPIVEVVMDFIHTSTQQEVEDFALAGKDRSIEVARLRARVSSIRSETAKKRREEIQQRMLSQSNDPRPNISNLSRDDLKKIISDHIANDDLSLTMAARNERGEIEDSELMSIVEDILSLKDRDKI